MSTVTRLINRLRVSRLEKALRDEVEFHIEMRAGQHVKAGMSQEEAMKRAREKFGDVGAVISGMRRARLSSVTMLVTMASLIGVLVVWVLQVTRSAAIPEPPPAPVVLHMHSLDAPGKTPPPPPPPPPSREECLEQAKRLPRICQ